MGFLLPGRLNEFAAGILQAPRRASRGATSLGPRSRGQGALARQASGKERLSSLRAEWGLGDKDQRTESFENEWLTGARTRPSFWKVGVRVSALSLISCVLEQVI